jgi:hypothetical protein
LKKPKTSKGLKFPRQKDQPLGLEFPKKESPGSLYSEDLGQMSDDVSPPFE